MAGESATGRRESRRFAAWLLTLVLLLNGLAPGLALRTLPAVDFLAGAICHAPGQDQPDPQAPGQHKAVCPVCLMVCGQVVALLPTPVAALPLPVLAGTITQTGPPARAVAAAAHARPSARAPPLHA